MSEILVVEDDPMLARGLQLLLQLEGYRPLIANTLDSANKLLSHKTVLVILDLSLPDGSGFEFLIHARRFYAALPVIILTAKVDEDSAVSGLELGANDYVRKPFGNRELIARINAVLRKSTLQGKSLQFGNVELLLEQRRVHYLDTKMELNRREFDILAYFFKKPETVITREAILNNIDEECKISDRTIDSHISHLRSSLKKSGISHIKITSVYGIGYRLETA